MSLAFAMWQRSSPQPHYHDRYHVGLSSTAGLVRGETKIDLLRITQDPKGSSSGSEAAGLFDAIGTTTRQLSAHADKDLEVMVGTPHSDVAFKQK